MQLAPAPAAPPDAAAAATGTGSSGWAATLILAVPLLVMYAGTFSKVAGEWWRDANNSHGLLIPPLAFYFAWQRRASWRACPISPWPLPGFAVVVAALGMYFAGRLGAEFFLTRFSLLVLVAGLVLYFRGPKHLRIIAFPLCLLVLAIPVPLLVWNSVSLPLQAVASTWSTTALQWCGIPVLRDGNIIHLANASLGVAEACSGLRSLLSLIALAVVLAYVRWSGWLPRALLVAAAVPLAVMLNVFRITVTGLIADFWSLQYALGFFHTFSGWIVFVLAFLLLFAFNSILERLPLLTPRERPV